MIYHIIFYYISSTNYNRVYNPSFGIVQSEAYSQVQCLIFIMWNYIEKKIIILFILIRLPYTNHNFYLKKNKNLGNEAIIKFMFMK